MKNDDAHHRRRAMRRMAALRGRGRSPPRTTRLVPSPWLPMAGESHRVTSRVRLSTCRKETVEEIHYGALWGRDTTENGHSGVILSTHNALVRHQPQLPALRRHGMQTVGSAAGRGTVAPVAAAPSKKPLPLGRLGLLSVAWSTLGDLGGPWGTGTRKRPAAINSAVCGAVLPMMPEIPAVANPVAAPRRTTRRPTLVAATWALLRRRPSPLRPAGHPSAPGKASSPTFRDGPSQCTPTVGTAAPALRPVYFLLLLLFRRGGRASPCTARRRRPSSPPASPRASPRCIAPRAVPDPGISTREMIQVPQPAAIPAPFCCLFQRTRDLQPPWLMPPLRRPLPPPPLPCTARRRAPCTPHVCR